MQLAQIQSVQQRQSKSPLSYLANAMDLATTLGSAATNLSSYFNPQNSAINNYARFRTQYQLPGGPYSMGPYTGP